LLLTLGNKSWLARVTVVRNAKNQPSFGTDALQSPKIWDRVWNGNHLEGAVLVKKLLSFGEIV